MRVGGCSGRSLRGLEIRSLLEEILIIVLKSHLNGAGTQTISNSEHDLLHLRSELLQIDGVAVVAVEFIENGVVELGELLWRSDDVDAEVGLQEPKGLEGLAELGAGEDAVAVEVKGREAVLDALIEQGVVANEVSHRGSVNYHHSHFFCVAGGVWEFWQLVVFIGRGEGKKIFVLCGE